MFTWSLLTLQGDKINWRCYASSCPTGVLSLYERFTESTHNEERLPHCCCSCGAGEKNKINKNKQTSFVRLKRWVQIYVPKLMASFNMKTEDNDCRRPIKSTLKSRWQNQSGAELLSCWSRENVFTVLLSVLSFFHVNFMWLLEWGDIQRAEAFSSNLYLHSRSDFSFSEVETDQNNNLILGQPLC